MRRLFESIGRAVLGGVRYAGGVTLLALDTGRAVFIAPVRWGAVLRQVFELGARSQPVVLITGASVGAVFAAQMYFQLRVLGMESAVPEAR